MCAPPREASSPPAATRNARPNGCSTGRSPRHGRRKIRRGRCGAPGSRRRPQRRHRSASCSPPVDREHPLRMPVRRHPPHTPHEGLRPSRRARRHIRLCGARRMPRHLAASRVVRAIAQPQAAGSRARRRHVGARARHRQVDRSLRAPRIRVGRRSRARAFLDRIVRSSRARPSGRRDRRRSLERRSGRHTPRCPAEGRDRRHVDLHDVADSRMFRDLIDRFTELLGLHRFCDLRLRLRRTERWSKSSLTTGHAANACPGPSGGNAAERASAALRP